MGKFDNQWHCRKHRLPLSVDWRVKVSYSINDLRKSVPAARCLSGLSGCGLLEQLRQVLGKLTRHVEISIDGESVTLEFHRVPAANLAESHRLMVRAAVRAEKGELQKAASLYRQVVTLVPSHQEARHRLALVLLRGRNTREGLDTLFEILKIQPTDVRALAILGKRSVPF